MQGSRIDNLSDKVDSLSGRVDTLGEQVSSLARAVERLSLVIGSSPLPASGPAGEASSAYPAPSDTSSVSGVSRSSQYNALAEEIPVVPDFCVALCGRLAAGTLSARQRAERAWESGCWAKFVLEGRIQKPRPSRPCDVANSIYVVLRAQGYLCPLYVTSASAYRAIVGDFKSDTLSHGFGSQAEAKVYCAGAGVAFPLAPHQWTSQQ